MAADEKKDKDPASTGPMDIPRQPGEDRPPTPDELPVHDQAKRDEAVRPSRSAAHDVDAERRRSHAPYTGTERRAR